MSRYKEWMWFILIFLVNALLFSGVGFLILIILQQFNLI